MKITTKWICLILAALCLLSGCQKDPANDATKSDAPTESGTQSQTPDTPPEEAKSTGTAVNVDCDAITYMYRKYGYGTIVNEATGEKKSLDDLEASCRQWFEDHYTDCGISDLLYNVDSAVPSTTHGDRVENYTRTEENGVAVDYTQNEGCEASYRVYTETEVDPFAVWIGQCYENGINPWLSFRMNDVHSADAATGHSDFFYTAKENGWFIGNGRASYWLNNACTQGSRNWYQYCLDYTVPEVRENVTVFIDEMLGRYDVYGIELDWQRCIWCFEEDSKDNCQYMDLLMQEVNRIVAKYEEQYGHEIKIMARIGRDIDENLYFGFDVRNWAKNDWIDVVVPCSYWGSTDSAMPIDKWVEALAAYEKVEIWAGLECNTIANAYWQSIATLAGYSLSYFNAGADKIYLYNLFNDLKEKFSVCSSLESATAAAKKSYLVTESNCTPYDVTGITQYDPLPLKAKVNNVTEAITIHHGVLNTKHDTVLYIGVSGVSEVDLSDALMTVQYNGATCTYKGVSTKSHVGEAVAFGYILQYNIPKTAWENATSGSITFDVGMNLTVNYIELMNGNSRL